MYAPASAILRESRPLLPRILVGEPALSSVLRVAEGLPAALVTHYVECRLAAGAPQVDYMACGTVAAGSPSTLAARNGRWEIAPSWRESPGWQRALAFFARWADAGAALQRLVPSAWMEFDLEESASEPPPPRIFLRMDPSGAAVAGGELHPELSAAVEDLLGRPPAPAARAAVARCVSRLPAGGRVVHLGAARFRGSDWVRCVSQVPADRVIDYLDAVGWPGAREAAREIVERLSVPQDGLLKVDVDVAEEITPRFAAFSELSRYGEGAFARARPLLDELVARGSCDPAKRDALSTVPARLRVQIDGHGSPLTIGRLMDIKTVIGTDGRLESKVYVGMSPQITLV